MAQPKRVQPAWQDAVCGGLGAMGASATVHAIDSFKIRLQLQGELDPHALRLPLVTRLKSIYQVEGLRGMYRGLSASMLRQSIYSTTRFGLHGALKNAINVYDATLFSYIGVKVATAMAAGAGGAMLSSPCDLVMVRMQADGRYPPAQRRNYRNVFDGLTRIAREDGLGGLWRGAVPNIKRAMIVTASQFVSYEKVKDLLCKYPTVWQFKKDHFATHFTASLMAGNVR